MTGRDAEVCIVGAGPHGLAVAAHLVTASPSLRDRLVVIDPAGSWMRIWHDQFRRLGIDVLRSAMVHHPGVDPGGLGSYIRRHALATSGLPYGVPLAAVFGAYCDQLVDDLGLERSVVTGRCTEIVAGATGAVVRTDAGDIHAAHVVVAANPATPTVPAAFGAVAGHHPRCTHSSDLDLGTLSTLAGEHIVVVGGGLTAGHLVRGAISRGATVTQVVRRPITVRDFDVDPGWLGPRELNRFGVERDAHRRLELVLAARGGGSVPPWMDAALTADCESGALRRLVHEATGATALADGRIRVEVAGTDLHADRVWLATGTRPSVDAFATLGSMATQVVDRYPVLDQHLRVPGTCIHVAGRLAAPTVGPAAGQPVGRPRRRASDHGVHHRGRSRPRCGRADPGSGKLTGVTDAAGTPDIDATNLAHRHGPAPRSVPPRPDPGAG